MLLETARAVIAEHKRQNQPARQNGSTNSREMLQSTFDIYWARLLTSWCAMNQEKSVFCEAFAIVSVTNWKHPKLWQHQEVGTNRTGC
jgi:hypothetical protein